ncbi:hypothetical protein [Pseudomonas sp. CLCA07]
MPSTKLDASKHSTTGTFTAKSDVDGDFVGAPLEMQLYKDKGLWYLGATQRLGSQPTEFKGIDLYLPGDIPGDGQPRSFKFEEPYETKARYWRYENGGSSPYTSIKGGGTVEYYAVEQRMKGSFDCTASFGSENITITDANFDLTGITNAKHLPPRTKQGQLTATLAGGISQEFVSDAMNVNQVDQELALTADHFVWEPLPTRQHRITLFIKDGVKAGRYSFAEDKALIRAAYVTPNQSPEVFTAISGELYLASDPTVTHLEGRLSFDAEGVGDPDKKVSVKEGTFRWLV